MRTDHDYEAAIVRELGDRQAMLDRDAEHARAVEQINGYRKEIYDGLKASLDRLRQIVINSGCQQIAVGGTLLRLDGVNGLHMESVHIIRERP